MYSILETAGAFAAAPGLFAGQEHSHASVPPSSSDPGAKWAPQFFTAEQNETLVALGERIVPGSGEAYSNRVIDLIMTVESDKVREELVQAMAAFDDQAQARHQKAFRALTSEQQDQILTSAVNDKGQLHSQFGVVKEWVADAYWSSEKGLREMGWTGRMAWETFPGCGHPGAHN